MDYADFTEDIDIESVNIVVRINSESSNYSMTQKNFYLMKLYLSHICVIDRTFINFVPGIQALHSYSISYCCS